VRLASQWITVADPEDQPLDVAVWYPSDFPVAPQALGLHRQTVAADGAISGSRLPLVVISHGSGGWAGSHFDTALALAEAGFVVAAITHTGDNFKDRSYAFRSRNLIGRPRHVVRTIDHMLTIWPAHERLDPTRIGIFGHSAGAFTALVAAGGTPNLDRIAQRCRERPEDRARQPAPERDESNDMVPTGAPAFMHDPRIGTAVIAATGLGMTFEDGGLSASECRFKCGVVPRTASPSISGAPQSSVGNCRPLRTSMWYRSRGISRSWRRAAMRSQPRHRRHASTRQISIAQSFTENSTKS
jgi:predicted dienelactone hydrolase